jgi:hypothetical protein
MSPLQVMNKRIRLSFPNKRISLSELQAVIVFIYCLACVCCSVSAFVWGNSGSRLIELVQRRTPWPTRMATRTPTAVAWVTGIPLPTLPADATAPPTSTPRPTEPTTPTATLPSPLATATLVRTPTPEPTGALPPTHTPEPTTVSSPLETPTPLDTPTPTQTPLGTPTPGDTPTPTYTPSPTPSLTPTPSGVHIEYVEWNPSGDEYEGEYVQIENRGPGSQDMTGWTLGDTSDHLYHFPTGFILAGGVSVRVWTKEGDDTQTNLYWGRDGPVWGNDGDTAYLWDEKEILIDHMTWPVEASDQTG